MTHKPEPDYREDLFRDEITDAFREGKVQIYNGWLIEVDEMGEATPLMDLWKHWNEVGQ